MFVALVNVMGDAGNVWHGIKEIYSRSVAIMVGVREHDKSIGPAATEANNNGEDDGSVHEWFTPLGALQPQNSME